MGSLLLWNRFVVSGLVVVLVVFFLQSDGRRLGSLELASAPGRIAVKNGIEETKDGLDSNDNLLEEQLKVTYHDFPHPLEPWRKTKTSNTTISELWLEEEEEWQLQEPLMGHHRPSADSVFSFVRGYDFPVVLRFLGSLLATGFDGDVVLGVGTYESLPPELLHYLQYHSRQSHVVVYEIKLNSTGGKYPAFQVMDMWYHKNETLTDPRSPRTIDIIRYEYYWAWSTLYHSPLPGQPSPRIMVSDSRDVWFQVNPFPLLPFEHSSSSTTLMVFEESPIVPISQQGTNIWWMSRAYGRPKALQLVHSEAVVNQSILCSGITVGGPAAMQTYTAAMISQWDLTHCNLQGCDQGFHNYLLYSQQLSAGKDSVDRILVGAQGESAVNTVGILHYYGGRYDGVYRKRGILHNATNKFLNNDGSVSPVVHQYDRDGEAKRIIEGPETQALQEEWQKLQYGLASN